MTEAKKERIDIILDLVGYVTGCGESHADSRAMENIEFSESVLLEILVQYIDNANYNGYEGSRLDLKRKSIEVLEGIKERIDEVLTE